MNRFEMTDTIHSVVETFVSACVIQEAEEKMILDRTLYSLRSVNCFLHPSADIAKQ